MQNKSTVFAASSERSNTMYLEVILNGRSRENKPVFGEDRVDALGAFGAWILDLVALVENDIVL